jgi:hypothetical protein
MGIFKIKAKKEAFSEVNSNKIINAISGLGSLDGIPITEITISLKMERPPEENEIDLISEKLTKIGVDVSSVDASWFEL